MYVYIQLYSIYIDIYILYINFIYIIVCIKLSPSALARYIFNVVYNSDVYKLFYGDFLAYRRRAGRYKPIIADDREKLSNK